MGNINIEELEREFYLGSDEAAREHLALGHPIYYGVNHFPEGIVKEYPDGRKQLVSLDENDNEIILKKVID